MSTKDTRARLPPGIVRFRGRYRVRMDHEGRTHSLGVFETITDAKAALHIAQEDWSALANVMQHLHDEGHDVQTLAQASITNEPLVSGRPAQAMRHRLAVIAPPTDSTPRPRDAAPAMPARPETERAPAIMHSRRPAGPGR